MSHIASLGFRVVIRQDAPGKLRIDLHQQLAGQGVRPRLGTANAAAEQGDVFSVKFLFRRRFFAAVPGYVACMGNQIRAACTSSAEVLCCHSATRTRTTALHQMHARCAATTPVYQLTSYLCPVMALCARHVAGLHLPSV